MPHQAELGNRRSQTRVWERDIRSNLDGRAAINRLFEGRDELFGLIVQDLHQALITQQL